MSKILKKILSGTVEAPAPMVCRRVGDFYEIMGENAKIAAGILDLALTTRQQAGEDPVPMCGFPYHSLGRNLEKLHDSGYQVGVIDPDAAPAAEEPSANGHAPTVAEAAPKAKRTRKPKPHIDAILQEVSTAYKDQTPILADPPTDPQVTLPANVLSAKEQIAAARETTGEGKRLRIERPNWAQVCQECVNVKVGASYWRAAEKLTLKALGLDAAPPEFQSFAASYLKLGQIRLAPPRYVQALDRAKMNAMNAVRNVSFPSPWGGRMVVLKAYPGLRSSLENFKADAVSANGTFVEEHGEWTAELRAEYRTLVGLQLALQAGQAAGEAELSPELTEQVESLVSALMANVKSAAEIEDLFAFDWVPSYVRAPDLTQGGTDLEALEERVLATQEYLAGLNEQAAKGRADLSLETERKAAEAELAAQQELLAAQKQIALDVAEKAAGAQMREINSVLDGAAGRLAGLFYSVTKEVRDSLSERGAKGHDGATKAHARKLAEVVEQVRLLNAWSDPNVEALADKLQDLASSLEKHPEKADASALDRTLADVQALVAADRLGLLEFSEDDTMPVLSPAGEDNRLSLAELDSLAEEGIGIRQEGTVSVG